MVLRLYSTVMHETSLDILRRNTRAIVRAALLGAILAIAFSFLLPREYSSTARLLVIPRSVGGTDPFTAIKSAERISDNLAQIIETTSFFDRVTHAGFFIDQSVFSADEQKKRRQWSRMVDTTVSRGSGILTVRVYHSDRDQATQIVQAISYVLTTSGWEYIGGDLLIRLLDAPLASRFPARPNFAGNAVSGFIVGAALGAGIVLVRKRKV